MPMKKKHIKQIKAAFEKKYHRTPEKSQVRKMKKAVKYLHLTF